VHLPVFQTALTKKAEDADAALREAAKHSTQSITDISGYYFYNLTSRSFLFRKMGTVSPT